MVTEKYYNFLRFAASLSVAMKPLGWNWYCNIWVIFFWLRSVVLKLQKNRSKPINYV